MDRHGTSMMTMTVVVTVLFALEFSLGLLPPPPTSQEALDRLADSPRFWATLVVNIGVALVAAWFATRDRTSDDSRTPP